MSTTSVPWIAPRPAVGGQFPAARRQDVCETVVLVAGVVRPTDWHRAIRRPLLDLPVDQERSLLDLWYAQVVRLARALATKGLTLRIRLDHGAGVPAHRHLRHNLVRVLVDRDLHAWRGSGGVLRDVAFDYPDDAHMVAVHAAQIPLQSLRAVVERLSETGADATLMTTDRGTCGSVAFLRCGCLREIPAVGFCDFHEQALPVISGRFVTRAVPGPGPIGMPVRTRSGYIQALRQYHHMRRGLSAGGPMAEDWRPAFGIVERGADVHPTAQVLDSVVLEGARVDRGAVLVRSVVCPGAVVRRDRVVVDQLVGSPR